MLLRVHLHLAYLLANLVSASRQMESLVLFAACLVAVAHSLALANHLKRISASAELTVTNLNPILLLILVRKFTCPDFNQYQIVIAEFLVAKVQLTPHVWLDRFPREVNARIFLNISIYSVSV